MIRYTLIYIFKDNQNQCLSVIKRKMTSKNKGKWIGVGGKLNPKERHRDCMFRETKEETGLIVKKYHKIGKIYFYFDNVKKEVGYLYNVLSVMEK